MTGIGDRGSDKGYADNVLVMEFSRDITDDEMRALIRGVQLTAAGLADLRLSVTSRPQDGPQQDHP